MLRTSCRSVVGVAGDGKMRRVVGVFLVAIAGFFGPFSLTVGSAIAQERGIPSGFAPATEGRGGSPGGTGDVADSATDADGKSEASGSDGSESVLGWIAHAPAPVVIVALVIAAMSFYLGALVVWMALIIARPRRFHPAWCARSRRCWNRRNITRPITGCWEIRRSWRWCWLPGCASSPAGLSQAQRATELANEDVTMEMEHRTTYLATVGTLGPMIGLVGTVYGMIIAFRVIATAGSSPAASQLAAGISTALYSTLFGIAISIPAIFFYAIFRNRIARLSLAVGMTAEPLLDQFAPGVRMSAPSPNSGLSPASPAHPHPFAVSAALAAAGGNPPRPALPAE